MKRLAFIRYLYQAGLAQSRGPWPFSSASLLTLHDAIEFLLQLGSQHLNVGKSQPDFMEYFTFLNENLKPAALGQQERVRQLNNARGALKHRGLFPSTMDLESYRDAATAFFLENTPVIFGIGFDEVSLVDFVSPESARDSLREAQELIAAGDAASAVNPIAFAYSEMIADYKDRKRDRPARDQFDFSSRIPSLQSLHSTLPTVEAFARETKRPFLGTCGGFQHALIEFARHVAGLAAADHAETNPTADTLVVAPLSCSMVERTGPIRFAPDSLIRAAYGRDTAQEGYHCSYGLNPAHRATLERAGLRFTAFDDAGDVRAAELPASAHPFFVGTLFQPERAALRGELPPLVAAFVCAAAA